MLKLLIFDHDMTIVDSSEGIMAALNLIAEELGKPRVTRKQVLHFAAVPMGTLLKEVWGEWRTEWMDLYRQKGAPVEHSYTYAYPEVPETLMHLRREGYFLAIASNRHSPKISMDKSDTSQYFDEIVGVGDGHAHKPDPAMLDFLMERFGATKEETLYIGDSDVDMQAGRAAGILSVGVTTGNFNKDQLLSYGAWHVIDKMSQLLPIVESLRGREGEFGIA